MIDANDAATENSSPDESRELTASEAIAASLAPYIALTSSPHMPSA